MTTQRITTMKLILSIILLNSHRTDSIINFSCADRFKTDLEKTVGPDEVSFSCSFIESTDLNNFYIKRPLKELTLIRDAVYLVRYIDGKDHSSESIKRLTLISYDRNDWLGFFVENEARDRRAHLEGVDEIFGRGVVAITEILFGISLSQSTPVKILNLYTVKPILFKDIVWPANVPSEIKPPYHKELQIEGPISSKVIKAIHEGCGDVTEAISIKYYNNSINLIKEERGDHIMKGVMLRRLELLGDATLLANADFFTFLNSKIETLALINKELVFPVYSKDKKINLLQCNNLELHNNSIRLLPLISYSSLESIEWIGTIYMKEEISLLRVISDHQICEEILKENISNEIRWHSIRNKTDIRSASLKKRLSAIFYNTPAIDNDLKAQFPLDEHIFMTRKNDFTSTL